MAALFIYEGGRRYTLPKSNTMAEPIWKDRIVTIASGVDSAGFYIENDATGTSIYSGVAYARPGSGDVDVKINDICADWLQNTFPILVAGMSPADIAALSLPVEFEVYDENGTVKDTVQFYDDWSYDPGFDASTMPLAAPINGRIDCRQWIPYTVLQGSDVTAVLYFEDGTTMTVILPLEVQADFNIDYNEDFAISTRLSGSGTAVFDLSQWSNVVKVVLNGVTTYEVVGCCYAYALLYRNAYGGWDTFLVEGNHLEADALTRYTVGQSYDNSTLRERGIRNYVNDIRKGWTLHTGLLTDEQAGRMHHLLNSVDVYLQDLAAGTIVPVVLTGTETEYKRHANGRRFAEYTITAELAQERLRR